MSRLADMRAFLLDMDGTIYLGDTLFNCTVPFLEALTQTGREYIFLTNNSSKNRDAYVQKLARLGIDVSPERVFTSGEATAITLKKEHPHAKLFLLGTPSLHDELERAGFSFSNNPDYVVLGFDTTLTYDKLWNACRLIARGVPYVATHPDFVCPLPGGDFMPDAGAIMALIKAATGISPRVIGKPNAAMADAAAEKYGFCRETTVMVGDRLYTDIAMGAMAGIRSALVLTGETTLAAYEAQNEYRADFVYPSVGEMATELLTDM